METRLVENCGAAQHTELQNVLGMASIKDTVQTFISVSLCCEEQNKLEVSISSLTVHYNVKVDSVLWKVHTSHPSYTQR